MANNTIHRHPQPVQRSVTPRMAGRFGITVIQTVIACLFAHCESEPPKCYITDNGNVHESASLDSLHIATATVNGMDYLLTWSCRHIANATLQTSMRMICEDAGLPNRRKIV